MKRLFLILFAGLSIPCIAQSGQGFDKREMKDMIAICNSFTFIDLYNSDADILPAKYKKTYTSGVFGMDNKFQIYEKGDLAVINLRGSTDKQISWLENIYAAMIPAKGKIQIAGETFDYQFAKNKKAAVHSGFALGIAYLHTELLSKINDLNQKGIYRIILTGHSQGGALANLFRSYLEQLPVEKLSKKNSYKVYTFGAPMVGNKEFAGEFNTLFCDKNTSFNIVNPADMIPAMPYGYNDSNFLAENIKNLLFDRKSFSIKKVVADAGTILLENKLESLVKVIGARTSKKISGELGKVEMPKYTNDINYCKLKNVVEIEKFIYPRILKDSGILQNDSLMAIYKRGADGHFLNEKLYEKGSRTYQHKPYNYYVAILKQYYPKEYATLKRKYLPENIRQNSFASGLNLR